MSHRHLQMSPLAMAATLVAAACGNVGDNGAVVADLSSRGAMQSARTSASSWFGGSVQGRPMWLSANGLVAAILRFVEDTDGDGRIAPLFGHHGEILGDSPQFWVYDIPSGQGTRYDEILLTDPHDRYLATRQADTIWLLDTETGSRLNLSARDILLESDENRCHTPRQLLFDPRGERVAFLRGKPPQLVLRSLLTGEEQVIESSGGELWRASLSAVPGWIFLYEVDPARPTEEGPEFPRQKTSCECTYCSMFAMSYSFQEWEGPEYHTILLSPDGERRTVEEEVLPVGREAYAAVKEHELFSREGAAIALPAGCGEFATIPGGPTVLLECTDGQRLFDPATRRQVRLPVWVELVEDAVAVPDSQGRHWAAVHVPPDSLQQQPRHRRWQFRLGRLRLEDGRLELGPEVQAVRGGTAQWVFGVRSGRMYLMGIHSGEVWELPVPGLSGAGASFVLWFEGDKRLVLNPEQGLFTEGPERLSAANSSGCFLDASSSRDRLDLGPWVRRCMIAAPAQ